MKVEKVSVLLRCLTMDFSLRVKFVSLVALSFGLVMFVLSAEANDRSEWIKGALEIGHRLSALRLSLDWLSDEPGSSDAAKIAGLVAKKCRRMEKEERVSALVNSWLEAHPKKGRNSVSRVCENLGLRDIALEIYETRLESDPNDGEACRGVARVFANAEKPDMAYQELQAYLARNPKDAAAYLDAARIDLMMGDTKAAIRAAEKVIASERKKVDRQSSTSLEGSGSQSYILAAHLLLADASMALRGADAVKRAASEYKKALAIDPKNADARYGLANALDSLGKAKQAQKEWDSFLKLENDTPRAGKAVYRKYRDYFGKEEWRNKWHITNDYLGGNSWWIDLPKQPENPTGGYDPNPGRRGILRMHPIGGNIPTELARLVTISREGGFLCIGVSGRYWKWNCDSVMKVIINGDIFAEEIINSGDAPSPENWYDFCYNLSDYAGMRVEIKIQVVAGGKNPWWGEEQFFDYIEVLDKL